MRLRYRPNREVLAHAVALSVALLGPLVNLLLGYPYSPPPDMYLYWAVALIIYICILLPLTFRSPLTLVRLVFLGIAAEDFFSNMWKHFFFGNGFLPFDNWYTQYFPFLGGLGEPTPYLLIPQWYILAFGVYLLLTIVQYRSSRARFGRGLKV